MTPEFDSVFSCATPEAPPEFVRVGVSISNGPVVDERFRSTCDIRDDCGVEEQLSCSGLSEPYPLRSGARANQASRIQLVANRLSLLEPEAKVVPSLLANLSCVG